jgi:uncharacterized delta-60 repeat protein
MKTFTRVWFVMNFVLFLLPKILLAFAGGLDPTFDFDGMQRIHFSKGDASAYAVAIQPDGKIVVCGNAFNGSDHDFMIVRLNTDGSLDNTFGTNGIAAANFGGEDSCKAVAVQADGKIVVAGTAQMNTADFALLRYKSDGSPDFNFGTNGRVTTDFFGMYDYAQAMLIQSNGKIVVAGLANHDGRSDFALARYNNNGSPDTNFDGDGKVMTILGSQYSEANGVVQQLDGKIVAVGFAESGSSDFALVRYNANGSLDTTFDNDGVVITDFGVHNATLNSVALQADGKIVAGGTVEWVGTNDFVLAKYNTNGSLDSNFGFNGVIMTPMGPMNDEIFAVLLQTDGKIIAVGAAQQKTGGEAFALVRFNNDGSIDSYFGIAGKVFTKFSGADDIAFDALLQPDGKIVAVGVAAASTSVQDFAMTRYDKDDACGCTYVEYFEGSNLPPNWGFTQGYWVADNGNLNGTSFGKKTEAVADPAFNGCELCSVETSMSTDGGDANKISLLAWYVDSQNYVEVTMSEAKNKWIVKQHYAGRVVAKSGARSDINPNVFYDVKIMFDGTDFMLQVNGANILTMRAVAAPTGTVGFRVKNTTGRFAFISVS